MPTDRPSLTVKDVADRFGVGPAAVTRWILAGELTAVNVSRSPRSKKPRWRVTETALEAFETRRTSTPLTPPDQLNTRNPMKDPADTHADYALPPPKTRADLIADGADPALVARLPVRHAGPDGEPYWPADEVLDLLTMLDREGGAA